MSNEDNKTPYSPATPSFIQQVIIDRQEDMHAYPLTRDKFELLLSSAVTIERQARDSAFGIFVGTLVGLVCFRATPDWDKHPFCLAILFAITLASLFCWIVFLIKCHRAKSSRTQETIEKYFEKTKGPDKKEETATSKAS